MLGGFVSREAAAKHYGVVISGFEVDQTGHRRAARDAHSREGIPPQ